MSLLLSSGAALVSGATPVSGATLVTGCKYGVYAVWRERWAGPGLMDPESQMDLDLYTSNL